MIVAIGGGDVRRGETKDLDSALIALVSGSPRLLFLPTAMRDAPEYAAGIAPYFASMGCEVRSLELTRNPSPKVVDAALEWANLVYVGGGDTSYLVKNLNRYAMKQRFEAALSRGVVLAGISAGAICWFDGGMAAYNGYKPLPGMGLAPGLVVPHYQPDDPRLLAWVAEHPHERFHGIKDASAMTWDAAKLGMLEPRSPR